MPHYKYSEVLLMRTCRHPREILGQESRNPTLESASVQVLLPTLEHGDRIFELMPVGEAQPHVLPLTAGWVSVVS